MAGKDAPFHGWPDPDLSDAANAVLLEGLRAVRAMGRKDLRQERIKGSGHVRHELSITRKATLPKETK